MEHALRVVDGIKSFRVCILALPYPAYNRIIRANLANGGALSHPSGILQETRLSALRPPNEFFDHNRVSRPADFTQAVQVLLLSTNCLFEFAHIDGAIIVDSG